MRIRQLATSLLAVIMLSAGAVALDPSSAEAATPGCNTAIKVKPRPAYSYYMLIPRALYSGSYNTFNCYMERGMTGPEVRALQRAIAYCYSVPTGPEGHRFGPGDIDGVYGYDTKHALEYVQGILVLEADGIYGPQTAAAIDFPWYNPSTDRWTSTCTRRDGS